MSQSNPQINDQEQYPLAERRRFSRVQVMEATAGAVLAAAVLATAGGVGWLLIALPSRLNQMQDQITRILENQDGFNIRFEKLEEKVIEQDRRIIQLEVGR